MIRAFTDWLLGKWDVEPNEKINQTYAMVFGNENGVKVLNHMLDRFYCVTYNGNDAFQLATMNGQRIVMQEILERLDMAEHPTKYTIKQEMESENAS